MNILLVRSAFILKHHYTVDYLQLSDSLKNLGHKVTLVGLGDDNKYGKDIILLKIPLNKRRFLLLKLSILLPIYCIIKKINVVIVGNAIIPGTFPLMIIKKIRPLKIIYDVRSIPVEENIQWDYKQSCKVAQKWYDGATFISDGTKEFIERSFNIKYKKSAIFTSAVNPSLFNHTLSNNVPENIKGLIENKIVLFYHGSISPNRGINLILDAVNEIRNEYPNILFLSISEANEYITEYCRINNYNLKENILLLNTVNHESMASYIDLADICIVPLPRIVWWEISSPLKLMEYLAMEKPIVLSDIKAHLSVVPEDSKFAYYFNPDKPTDIIDKINLAIKNIDLLKKYSHMGREIILSKFTWDHQAKLLEKFIYSL